MVSLLILFAQLFLRLDYLAAPLATLILLLSTSLFCASLGLLIGAVARNEEQAIIFSLVLMFVLAGVGGAWFPLELTPEAFQRIASLTPAAWIVEGLKDIAVRGLGLGAALAAAGAAGLRGGLFWPGCVALPHTVEGTNIQPFPKSFHRTTLGSVKLLNRRHTSTFCQRSAL